MRIFLILLLIAASMNTEALKIEPKLSSRTTINFMRLGQLVPTKNMGHIHFVLPLENIKQNLRELSAGYLVQGHHDKKASNWGISSSLNDLEIVTRESSLAYSQQAKSAWSFKSRQVMVEDLRTQFYSITEHLANPVYEEENREKRQLLLGLAALLGIGNSIASAYTVDELHELKQSMSEVQDDEDRILAYIDSHDMRIKSLESNMVSVRKFANLAMMKIEKLADNEKAIMKHSSFLVAHGAVQTQIQDFSLILGGLMNQRLHPAAAKYINITHGFDQIKEQASKFGYRLLPQSVDHAFQMEASYMIVNNSINIFVHIPLVKDDAILNLYFYKSIPLKTSNPYVHIEIDVNDANILAINAEKTFFQILSKNDLDNCNRQGKFFLCQNENIYQKGHLLGSQCLGALFNFDSDIITKICPHKFVKPKNSFYQISPSKYLSFAPKVDNIISHCKKIENGKLTETNDESALHDLEMITIDQHCTVESSDYIIGASSFFETGKLFFSFDRPVDFIYAKDKLLDDFSGMEDLIEDLEHSPIEKNQAKSNIRLRKNHRDYIGAGLVFGIVLVIVIIGMAFIWWRLIKNKKKLYKQMELVGSPSFAKQ